MILYIDTTDKKLVTVKLKDESGEIDTIQDENEFGSQVLLPMIEQILKKNNKSFKDLTSIEVETGPGSFTGIRVGVSIANTLAYSLKIPVNGKEMETEITYS